MGEFSDFKLGNKTKKGQIIPLAIIYVTKN